MASSAGVLRCHCHIVVVIDGFGFGLCFSFGGFRVISYVHIVVTLSFFFFFFFCVIIIFQHMQKHAIVVAYPIRSQEWPLFASVFLSA